MTAVTSSDPRTAARWSLILLRVMTAAVVVVVLIQGALAGSFLSGSFESLAAHARNAVVLGGALLLQTLAAVLAWRLGVATVRPMLTSLAQILVAAALITLGEERILTVHVPLAILLTLGVVHSMVSVWRT